MSFERFEQIVGYIGFAAAIAAHFLFDIVASVRVVGLGCIVSGVIWVVRRSIPMGWEGQPPSFYVTAIPALVVGVAMAVLGVALVAFSSRTACSLGWQDAALCP